MTVIIGSLFLPYTVQFEIDSQLEDRENDIPAQNSLESGKRSGNTTKRVQVANGTPSSNSIFPTLSLESSNQHTPILPSPGSFEKGHRKGDSYDGNSDMNTAEEFFYNKKLKRVSHDAHSAEFTDRLNEKLGSQLVQPKPRIGIKVQSSVVDAKKANEDEGLSAMKISRSSGNLSGLNVLGSASSNLLSLTPSAKGSGNRSRSSLGKQIEGFTLNTNSSSNSLAIAEEDEVGVDSDSEGEWKQNFYDMLHGRSQSKLAPFGGFSRPEMQDGILNQENIFDNAPWSVVLAQKGNASLTKAVKRSKEVGIMKSCKWVGTISMPSDVVPSRVIDDIARVMSDSYNSEAIFPSDATFQGHYNSFCKQILWPTLHYQIPDDPKSKAFEDHSWEHYRLLNQLMADKIVEVYLNENANADPNDPENMIWIHDYHLLLVPQMVRDRIPNVKIGLFLHVSFPSSEVFRCFGQREALLRGMLGADCISFQTEEYVRHFLQTCSRLLLADTNEFGLTFESRLITTNTIPIGIDAKSLKKDLQSEGVKEWRRLIREKWKSQHLIVSRDKLDKLRGIKQKLLAYERFLKQNPEYVDTTVLIQVCIGKSQDSDYEAAIMHIVGRINSMTENIGVSQPVVLLHQDIEFDQYLALECEADTFVVSSMREGLNLTCHEFITATESQKSPLILSEFTGSSSFLNCGGKGALSINPWDIKRFSEVFKESLTLSEEEKSERWNNCYNKVITHDSNSWVSICLKSINAAWRRDQESFSSSLIKMEKNELKRVYDNSRSGPRVFILNLETPAVIYTLDDRKDDPIGSTMALVGKSTMITEPTKLISSLADLTANPQNLVYIISYLRRADLDILFKRTPNLGLIAENGGYIKLIGSSKWISIVDESEINSWMPQVTELIQSKVERLPGSSCEVEDCTVRFDVSKPLRENSARSLDAVGDCIQHINEVFHDKNEVHATLNRNVVIVQQNQLSLKALRFIISYYNAKARGIESETLVKEYHVRSLSSGGSSGSDNGLMSPPLKSPKGLPTKRDGISFILFSGGTTPIDEQSYEYLNAVKDVNEIDDVLTIAVLGADLHVRTSARYCISGKKELLDMLARIDEV